jgi:hypothetical protein
MLLLNFHHEPGDLAAFLDGTDFHFTRLLPLRLCEPLKG